MPPQHVLIVGGGLAGPSLAIALARLSIASTIFEIRPSRVDSGGSISLAPNATCIFDRTLGLYDQIKAAGYTYRTMTMYDDTGYRYGEIGFGIDSKYDAVRIMRSEVHRILLQRCQEKGIEIVWGAKNVAIEQDNDEVRLCLPDGRKFTGTVLVGADGLHSKVRECVLDNPPIPVYSGSCTVASFVERSFLDIPASFEIPAAILSPLGMIMTVPVNPEGTHLTFGVSEPLEEPKTRSEWLDYEKSGEAGRKAKENYRDADGGPLRSLIDNIKPTEVRLWAPYSIPTLPSWHNGRMVLIGDAAHALPPNGQGSAMAFEDAAVLARMIANTPNGTKLEGWDKTFAKFEALRRPRLEQVAKISRRASTAKSRTSRPMWFVQRWGLWAAMRWYGGRMNMPGIAAYDVESADISVSLAA